MTLVELKSILTELTKNDTSITEEMIDNVIDSNDFELLIENNKGLFTYEKWDEISPINNASAELIKKQLPFVLPEWNGMSYTIKKDDRVIFFEKTDFELSGWTPIKTIERLQELAESQIILLATNKTIEDMLLELVGD